MSNSIQEYKIMLSCPADVEDQKPFLQNAVDRFNKVIALLYHIQLCLTYWKKDTLYGTGDAQKLIDNDVTHQADMVFGLFWKKTGTARGDTPTGPIGEIEKHVKANHQVWVAFKKVRKPVSYKEKCDVADLEKFEEQCKDWGGAL